MAAYDMIARRYHQIDLAWDAESDIDLVQATEPFKLLIDEDARRVVLERAVAVQPTRGHRNPIKAVPVELEEA